MLKITNEKNLPLPIVTWLLNDDYDYNPDPLVVSATSLIKSTKKTVLSQAVVRSDTIQVHLDVSDKLASIRGQNLHAAIEASYQDHFAIQRIAEQLGMPVPEVTMEERLYGELEVDGVIYKISGKFDAIIDKILHDWKTESTFSFGDETKKRERIYQLSIYAWLCWKNGKECDTSKATYFSIYQNWMKGMAAKADPEKYPSSPMLAFEVDLLPFPQLEMWMKNIIRERRDLSIEDVDGVQCSQEDLWMGKGEYQYFTKETNKRASKNFTGDNAQSEAMAYLASKNNVGVIKEKPRKAKACEYCFGSAICSQYQSLVNQGYIENESNVISLSPAFGETS